MKFEKLLLHRITVGYCPCCEKKTIFISRGYWYRDDYICMRCKSIPRMRALMTILDKMTCKKRDVFIHESSPNDSEILWMRKFSNYSYSYYYDNKPLGINMKSRNCTNQNLCKLQFDDNTFDFFITQDVMEHVDEPIKAFREIERVLKPGGMHIFTTPIYLFSKTRPRIKIRKDGTIKNILKPVYHGNPIDGNGSLVTYDYGDDIVNFIDSNTSFKSQIISFHNSKDNYRLGLEGDYLYVIVSKK